MVALFSVKVTVGLCVKNGEATIKSALDSLTHQTFPSQDIELLVVDGYSTDQTLKIILDAVEDSNFHVRVFREGNGLGFARQIVVKEASGKYIVWLDADMTFPPEYIESQFSFMETNPKVGIAAGKCCIHIGYGLVADLENIVYAVDSVFGHKGNASKFGYLPGAEGAMYRVSAVRQVGGFDTEIGGAAEDTEMAYRVKAGGWELAEIDAEFTEANRASWFSLWTEYEWYGQGGHYIFHKDPDSLNLIQMSPMAGFIAGILRSPGAYLLTHNKLFFLLPIHYTYKRLAWLFGFCDAHLNGYGHHLNHHKK
jgi:glycosyltransferase involved in cell wall biosynthesis